MGRPPKSDPNKKTEPKKMPARKRAPRGCGRTKPKRPPIKRAPPKYTLDDCHRAYDQWLA